MDVALDQTGEDERAIERDQLCAFGSRRAGPSDARDASVFDLDIGSASIRKPRMGKNRRARHFICRHAQDFMQ